MLSPSLCLSSPSLSTSSFGGHILGIRHEARQFINIAALNCYDNSVGRYYSEFKGKILYRKVNCPRFTINEIQSWTQTFLPDLKAHSVSKTPQIYKVYYPTPKIIIINKTFII